MRRFARYAVVFLSFGVALYAVLAYSLFPMGAAVHPDMAESFRAHAAGIYLHVFSAVLALALGPFQFWTRLRTGRPALHRWMGHAYLGVGVLAGGASGLYIAQFAHGGVVSRLGFSLLALAWLYTGWRAYASIRGGDVTSHREWMVRNFALTLAAVTLRLYFPLSMLAGIPFEAAYRAIAWLCWVPNLLGVYLWQLGWPRTRKMRA
jgi:uncharacterized membrane protein